MSTAVLRALASVPAGIECNPLDVISEAGRHFPEASGGLAVLYAEWLQTAEEEGGPVQAPLVEVLRDIAALVLAEVPHVTA